MSFKKKAVSLLLTGTLAATVFAPTALAGEDYYDYTYYLDFPQPVSGYRLVSSATHEYDDWVDTENDYYPVLSSDYVSQSFSYTYDSSGHLTSRTEQYFYKPSTYRTSTTTFQCDNSGRIIGYKDSESNVSFTYNTLNQIEQHNEVWSDSSGTTEVKYEYDSHGNRVKEVCVMVGGGYRSTYRTYYTNQYNNFGQLVQKKDFLSTADYKSGYYAHLYNYSYNSKGQLIKETEIYADDPDSYDTTYEYDSSGNVIKKSVYNKYGHVGEYTTYTYEKTNNGSITPEPTGKFTDIFPSVYYIDAVAWAVDKGVTSGTSSTTFSPDQSCTRGQIMQMLWRAMDSPEPSSTTNPFADVKSNDYFYKAVLWAVENNITSGTTETTFGSNVTCTRAQAMTFLWNAKGKQSTSNSIAFADVQSGDYFYNPVKWAVNKGVTSGTSASTFSPTQNCTRAQIVTFIYKAMN